VAASRSLRSHFPVDACIGHTHTVLEAIVACLRHFLVELGRLVDKVAILAVVQKRVEYL